MKSLRVILSAISATATLALLRMSTAAAQTPINSGAQSAHGTGLPTDVFGDGAIFATVVNSMLFLIGAIAVIMLIYGGFRYVISGGNSSSVTAAKNTILYAIIGVIVALLSYAIVNFVLESLQTGGGTTGL